MLPSSSVSSGAGEGVSPLAGGCVLLVEDDPPSAKLVAVVLRHAACNVQVSTDPDAAILLLLAGLQPDAILLDLDLPGMGGLALARFLRVHPATARLPVIAVSASGAPNDERSALSAGCDAYIRKPIDVGSFSRTVADYLARPA